MSIRQKNIKEPGNLKDLHSPQTVRCAPQPIAAQMPRVVRSKETVDNENRLQREALHIFRRLQHACSQVPPASLF